VENLLVSAEFSGGKFYLTPLPVSKFWNGHCRPASPWVEPGTIQTEVKTREVRFSVGDTQRFDEGEIKKALQAQGFPEAVVKSRPAST
jgi:hypothetical protein